MSTSSITHSNSELNVCPHVTTSKGSTKSKLLKFPWTFPAHRIVFSSSGISNEQSRRVSVQIGSTAAMKGNFVVSQSDLWDTHTLLQAKQRACTSPRNQKRNNDYCSNDYHSSPSSQHGQMIGHTPASSPHTSDYGDQTPASTPGATAMSPGMMQRSVSEKNRSKHRNKPKVMACQSETDSERDHGPCKKLAKSQHTHHHSTPNVAPDGKHKHRAKKDSSSSMYGACSETELLEGDTAILPIFRKLLTERESSRYRHRMVGASCPNISIKCDIVEYL